MLPRMRIAAAVLVTLVLPSLACSPQKSLTAPVERPARAGTAGSSLFEPGPAEPGPTPDVAPAARINEPPRVTITSPRPNPFIAWLLLPGTTVHWTAEDPDGPGPNVKSYRYRVLRENDPEFPALLALINPDSLLHFYAPRFDGWTEVSGNVEAAVLPELPFNERCVFAITAFDRRGNYDDVFTVTRNMLIFTVTPIPTATGAGPDGPDGGSARYSSVPRRMMLAIEK